MCEKPCKNGGTCVGENLCKLVRFAFVGIKGNLRSYTEQVGSELFEVITKSQILQEKVKNI